ncbi:MAG: AhpC/TSA family protein [Bacteroides sp.]|nr:AhpC/TSA family protein [Bacteroides sp.]
MKKIYFVCCLLVLTAACGDKTSDSTVLNGEIKGLGNDTLYLYGADKLYDRINTLWVKNDKLSANLKIDTLVAARLLFGDGTTYPLFLDKNQKITIKGSADALQELRINGVTANDELTAFHQKLKAEKLISGPEQEAAAEAFIKEHPYSLVSIYLLEKYFIQKPQPNYDRIEQLLESIGGELKDRPGMAAIQTYLQDREKAVVNRIAPYFQLPNAEGKRINRNNFRKQHLLVHFWASWNPQSRKANAALRDIYRKEKKNEKFALLGISLDLDRAAWIEAIEQDTLQWEQVCDFNGWETTPVKQLVIQQLPSNILLSPTGKILAKDLTPEEISQKIEELKETDR